MFTHKYIITLTMKAVAHVLPGRPKCYVTHLFITLANRQAPRSLTGFIYPHALLFSGADVSTFSWTQKDEAFAEDSIIGLKFVKGVFF